MSVPNEMLRQPSAASHFGRVTMAGRIPGGAGVSFSSMRVLGSYAIVFLYDGCGRYQLSGEPARRCRAGDLLIVFPEIAHGYGPDPGGRWGEIYLVFEGAVFDLWRQQGLISPGQPILHLPQVRRNAKVLWEIARQGRSNNPARQLAQVCRLQSFLASAISLQAESACSDHSVWPAWVVDTVETMAAEPGKPAQALAASAGFSYESFRKKFRDITGLSPSRYQDRLTIDLARKLIYEQRLSNKELADQLGFCDEFHFSRRFRLLSGQSPKEFRRSLPKNG